MLQYDCMTNNTCNNQQKRCIALTQELIIKYPNYYLCYRQYIL